MGIANLMKMMFEQILNQGRERRNRRRDGKINLTPNSDTVRTVLQNYIHD